MRCQRLSVAILGLAGLLLTSGALADPPPAVTGDKEKAREWAEKASARFDAGDYAGAVEAMKEAETHYRAPTFLQLHARALEKLGRFLEARAVYRTLAAWEMPANAAAVWLEAKNEASQRLQTLDARIPKLVLTLEGAVSTVSLDGSNLSLDALARPLDVDPGEHTLVATAQTGAKSQQDVMVRVGTTEHVRVAVVPGIPASPSGIGLTPLIAAFGVGAASLVVGAVAGGVALSKKEGVLTGIDACGSACSSAEKIRLDSALQDARTFAGVSTVGFVVGGLGAAAGATLLVLRRPKGETAPVVRISIGGISLAGTF